MFRMISSAKDNEKYLEDGVPKWPFPLEYNVARLSNIPQLILVTLQKEIALEVEKAARELGELTRGNEKECRGLYRMGGHGLILAALMRWPQNETIQAHCILTLSSVASFVPDCQDALLALGFVDIIAGAMVRFPDYFDVQVVALSAVYDIFLLEENSNSVTTADISCSLKEGINSERRHFVNDFHGLELILNAMSQFPNNSRMQLGGCRALGRLSSVKDFEKALSTSDVVVTVATVLKKFHDDEDLRKSACEFMKNLFGP